MEEILLALLRLFEPTHLFFLFLGTMVGLIVGVLPGLGGTAGLSIVLPFAFGMEPSAALAMMIGLLAPTTTSDTFPAVLMGIPGTAGSQATVVDGFPLAKQGQGARALGAAFTASLFGGLFGALVLTGAVFVALPIILAVGFGEQMILVILALTMIGMLTGSNALKGIATCGIGLMIGVIGAGVATAEWRLAFGQLYLADGIPIVIIGLGMFAMPEIIDLLRRQTTISETGDLGEGWVQGFKDAFIHRWIVLRCSIIGCLVGILPGLGGSVVDWIAYGHVLQTSRDRENFGKGDIRGVLAPESANNAKEGGALIPTLLFGIPGSGSMAILLGGFVLIGVEPGIDMIVTNLDLTYTMIWSLALANVIGAGVCLFLAGPVARLTTIRYSLLAPVMFVVIFFAAYQATRNWGDLIALFVFGTLGVYMKRFGWPRPALLIGFFLASRLEASTYQALQVYGLTFLQRPGSIILVILTILSVIAALRFKPNKPSEEERQTLHGDSSRYKQAAMTIIFMIWCVIVFHDSTTQKFLARIFPMGVSVLTFIALAVILAQQLRTSAGHTVLHDTDFEGSGTMATISHYLAWIVGMLALVAVVGFPIAMLLFIVIFTTVKAGPNLVRNLAIGLFTFSFIAVMSYFLTLRYPQGLLQMVFDMPWWLGG